MQKKKKERKKREREREREMKKERRRKKKRTVKIKISTFRVYILHLLNATLLCDTPYSVLLYGTNAPDLIEDIKGNVFIYLPKGI